MNFRVIIIIIIFKFNSWKMREKVVFIVGSLLSLIFLTLFNVAACTMMASLAIGVAAVFNTNCISSEPSAHHTERGINLRPAMLRYKSSSRSTKDMHSLLRTVINKLKSVQQYHTGSTCYTDVRGGRYILYCRSAMKMKKTVLSSSWF